MRNCLSAGAGFSRLPRAYWDQQVMGKTCEPIALIAS
jgi:hypothetical protein